MLNNMIIRFCDGCETVKQEVELVFNEKAYLAINSRLTVVSVQNDQSCDISYEFPKFWSSESHLIQQNQYDQEFPISCAVKCFVMLKEVLLTDRSHDRRSQLFYKDTQGFCLLSSPIILSVLEFIRWSLSLLYYQISNIHQPCSFSSNCNSFWVTFVKTCVLYRLCNKIG